MRILLTNNTLANRAGSELYIRDVAVELARRGHHPVAYSTRLGAVAGELRQATIPVIDNLAQLGESPDVIHGNHHFETLTAMLWFPRTPAISFCLGFLPWEEAPLVFPRILRYVAVDELCRERLIAEGGVAPEKITLLLNFFDERLFPPRPSLPPAPRRALAFGNHFQEDWDVPLIREACRERGIELDVVGLSSGRDEPAPGPLLAQYDLVFAKARAAIEAMAVGCAVILSNAGRMGTLVTRENFPDLRRLNFGVRTLNRPLTQADLLAEIDRYDAGDAAAVSSIVRQTCELQPAVDQLERLYGDVVSEAAGALERSDSSERMAAEYLQELGRKHKYGELIRERQALSDRVTALERTVEDLQGRLDRQREDGEAHLEDARLREEGLSQQRDGLQAELQSTRSELTAVRQSATWRLTQTLLASFPVRVLFGRLIDKVVAGGQRGR